MENEISDAIKDQEFKKSTIEIIKKQHNHNDGSEVILTPIDKESDIERKIIEEEEWKLKTQQANNANNENNDNVNNVSNKKPIEQVEQNSEPTEKKPKTITASCNCGQLFSATSSNEESLAQGKVEIKTYDASGSQGNTYTASGNKSNKQDYAVNGSNNEDYAKQ
ncbi:hypothetical protein CMO88_03845 [Candidatus Woesearchaeota archaeon]|nr:hypothetical protein [Candidatus Woesearchaeota archaeon]|tara:strand:- start:34032 stop:34526 length:495 start_codon:yes stop_codon:yes gene_type:complete